MIIVIVVIRALRRFRPALIILWFIFAVVLWEQRDVFLGQWVVQRVIEVDLRDMDALLEMLEARL